MPYPSPLRSVEFEVREGGLGPIFPDGSTGGEVDLMVWDLDRRLFLKEDKESLGIEGGLGLRFPDGSTGGEADSTVRDGSSLFPKEERGSPGRDAESNE